MLRHETIQAALQDRNLSAIARKIGVSIHTLVKMRNGNFGSLFASKVEAVSDYLESTVVREQ